jgi:hypothetical protein
VIVAGRGFSLVQSVVILGCCVDRVWSVVCDSSEFRLLWTECCDCLIVFCVILEL